MKETIEAFLKNCFVLKAYILLGLKYFYILLYVPVSLLVYQTWKNFRNFWKSLIFGKITFANSSFDFLPGIDFCGAKIQNRKNRKSFCPRKFLLLNLDIFNISKRVRTRIKRKKFKYIDEYQTGIKGITRYNNLIDWYQWHI